MQKEQTKLICVDFNRVEKPIFQLYNNRPELFPRNSTNNFRNNLNNVIIK